MDHVRERFEALEQHMKVMGAHTRTVERRLRWWHGIARGLVVLSLLSWAPPFGMAQDLLQQPSQSPRVLEPPPPVTRPGPYGHLPLSFEANQGQTDDQVQFLAHGQRRTGSIPKTGTVQDTPDTACAVVRMQLLGANPASRVMGLEKLPGKA